MGCIVFDTQCVSFTARTSVWTRLTASAQSPVAGSTAQLKSSGGQQTTEDQPGRGLKNSEKGGAAEDAAREEERRARCIRRPPGGGGALLTSGLRGFFGLVSCYIFIFVFSCSARTGFNSMVQLWPGVGTFMQILWWHLHPEKENKTKKPSPPGVVCPL